jgi:ATP-dependent Clp protease ATP-binding subunit ClpC
MNISVRFSPGVIEHLVRKGTDLKYGARPLKRAIKKYIEAPLTNKLIDGTLPKASIDFLAKMCRGDIIFVEE